MSFIPMMSACKHLTAAPYATVHFQRKKKADNTTLAKSRPMSNLLTHNCHNQQIEEKLALI